MTRIYWVAFVAGLAIALSTAPANSLESFTLPVNGTITSVYGMRWGRMHDGIDIAAPHGTPILAAADGVVSFVGQRRGYGLMIDLRHNDGSLTRYAHNSQNFAALGASVHRGDTIAAVGCTGHCTGPHVHFEVILPEIGAVDPLQYVQVAQLD